MCFYWYAYKKAKRERMCEGKPYGFPSRSINPPQRQISALRRNLLGLGTKVPRPSRLGANPPSPFEKIPSLLSFLPFSPLTFSPLSFMIVSFVKQNNFTQEVDP